MLRRVLLASIAIVAATTARWLMDPVVGDRVAFITLYGALAFCVWIGGWQVATALGIVGYLITDWLFLSPRGSLDFLGTPGAAIVATGYVVSAGLIIFLGERMRRAERRSGVAEARLREVGQLRDQALAAAHAGTWRLDLTSGVQTRDGGLNDILGLSAHESTQPIDDFYLCLHVEDREAARRAHADGLATGVDFQSECRIVQPQGEVRWISNSGRVVRNPAGEPRHAAGIVVDITERKRAEGLLLEARRLYQTVTDNATQALFIMNDAQECVFMNPAAEQLTGFTLDEVRGRALHDVIHHLHPDGSPYPLPECPIDRALPENDHEQGEEVFVHKDGHFYPVAFTASPVRDEGGRPTGTVIEVRDISVDKRVRDELEAREKRYRSLVAVISDVTWVADPSGAFVEPQPAWQRYTGQHWEQHRDFGWTDALHPDDREDIVRDWMRSRAREAEFSTRGRLWHEASRAYRHFLVKATPVRDADDRLREWVGACMDVHEHFVAEEQRRLIQEAERRALLESQRVGRMKDEFLATLSHELRTPMSAILGWAQMLNQAAAEPARVAKGLEVIERNARLQSRLISDLLDMNRILSGKLRLDVESVNIGEIVSAAVDAIRPAAEAKEIRLTSLCDPTAMTMRGDATRLHQVVFNLLSNAVKFTPRGGRIDVTCRRVNSHIEVSISDTGIGISAEFMPQLFSRFNQQDASTSRRFGGLGLGLSIVKQLVELHGGTVQGQSAGTDCGATFTVHLPVAVAVAPHLPEQALVGAHPELGGDVAPMPGLTFDLVGVRILVIDDEPDARELLRHVLSAAGAQVRVAGGGAEALGVLQEGLETFDLLICDIGMPDIDGYELIRRVRSLPAALGGATPALALTAFARSQDRTRSLLAGFVAHLSKPVELPELLATVHSAIGATRDAGRRSQPPDADAAAQESSLDAPGTT